MWMFFSVIIFIVCAWPVLSAPVCSKQRDNFYNRTSELCERCPACPIGTGRDFKTTNSQTVAHGEDECVPCQSCDSGYYSDAKTNKCRRCRKKCSLLNRRTSSECRGDHEAFCGSCLSGYRDEYGSETLPCREIPFGETEVTAIPPERHTATEDLSQDESARAVASENKQVPSESSASLNGGIVLLGISVVLALIAVPSVIFIARRDPPFYRRIVTGSRSSSGSSIETKEEITHEANSPLIEVDLEVDGPGFSEARVQDDIPHGELSTMQSNGPNALSSDSAVTNCTQGAAKYKCGHLKRSELNSSIDDSQYRDHHHVNIKKGDGYLTCVAKNVCHDPDMLYRALGIPDNKIYQNQDDRNIDPEKFPVAVVVLNILNSWVEIKGSPRLNSLLNALYRSDFDNIANELINKYNDSIEKR